MKKLYPVLFLIISICFFQVSVYSQQVLTAKSNQKRPKVGLILSGGGAKGFAYIGLFKVLKEIGLHIDYIGGASIGSIMAGFYAAGYDPDSIPSIVRSIDWNKVMHDEVDRKYIPFIDKQMGNPLIVQLPLDKPSKGGISMKKSLFVGQNVELLLSRYFAPFYYVKDFSKLPIPMFCTATDLFTGESVVLKEGNLEKAIRSSMSIPGYFQPVYFQGRYLIDGGVVNNYPVVDAKEKFGMQYIIGGDVQQGLENDISKLNNILSVIEQVIAFSNVESSTKGKENTDLYIHFDMGPYDMMSFNDYDSIIAIGERTARAHFDELKKLNDSLNAIEYVPGNTFNTNIADYNSDSINIVDVRIEGLKRVSKKFVNNSLIKLAKKNRSIADIEKEINFLYGSGFFELVTYTFEEPPEEKKHDNQKSVVLVITVKEKSLGTLAAGVHYDSDYNIGLLFNGYFRNLLVRGSKFLINLNLSRNINLKFTYLMERGPKAGLGFTGHIYSFNFGDFDEGNKLNELKFTNYKASMYLQSTLNNQFQMRAGGDYEYFKVSQIIQSDTLLEEFSNFNSYFTLFSDLKVDTRDKAFYATSGHDLNVRAEYVIPISKNWTKDIFNNALIIYGDWQGNFSLGKKERFVLQPAFFAGFTVNENKMEKLSPINHWFGLGGLNNFNYQNNIKPFIGTRFIQIWGTNAFIARMALQYNVYKKLYLIARDDFGSAWGLNETQNSGEKYAPLINGYGLTVGYNSFIGPAEITFMDSNIYGFSVFLSVGFWF